MHDYGYVLQTSDLMKEIESLKKSVQKDLVEQALREVKEYAGRSAELNVDTLQMKLMHLDEVARRVSHENRELYALALQRFLDHKENKKVGFLVSQLLSTPTESKLYDKEHKFLKLCGKEVQSKTEVKTEKEKEKPKEMKTTPEMDNFLNFFAQLTRTYYPLMPTARHMYPVTRQMMGPERGAGRGTPRFMNSGSAGCWKCGDPSHYQASCDRK